MKHSKIIVILVIILMASSCSVSSVPVGNFDNIDCRPSVHASDRDFYLFWDNVPIRRLADNIEYEDYEVVSRRGFFDTLIYYGTLGTFSFYKVRIRVKDCNNEE